MWAFTGNMSWDKEEFFLNMRLLLERLFEVFPTFWNYALFSVDKNSITVGKLIIGFSFLIGGYICIRILVSYFENRVLSRLEVEIPKRYTIKVLLFYFLISILFLFVLYLIEVPLTVFTFVGGALALGIGFGAKNIMNNFISGIAIVIEHPIRVGDLIEIDQLRGMVEHIGFRATSVRSLDNVSILIPNSMILEQNILNWTLSDKVIRSEIAVGVVYGSPLDKVKKVLLSVAEEHEKVLTYNKNQRPIVFFSDFGENSLQFQLSYWIAVDSIVDIRRVASELRFKIDEEFKKEGIVFAFPQRDLHIRQPVNVEITSKH